MDHSTPFRTGPSCGPRPANFQAWGAGRLRGGGGGGRARLGASMSSRVGQGTCWLPDAFALDVGTGSQPPEDPPRCSHRPPEAPARFSLGFPGGGWGAHRLGALAGPARPIRKRQARGDLRPTSSRLRPQGRHSPTPQRAPIRPPDPGPAQAPPRALGARRAAGRARGPGGRSSRGRVWRVGRARPWRRRRRRAWSCPRGCWSCARCWGPRGTASAAPSR